MGGSQGGGPHQGFTGRGRRGRLHANWSSRPSTALLAPCVHPSGCVLRPPAGRAGRCTCAPALLPLPPPPLVPTLQDAYYVLLLVERVAAGAPASMAWPAEGEPASSELASAQGIWEQVLKLLLHRCGGGGEGAVGGGAYDARTAVSTIDLPLSPQVLRVPETACAGLLESPYLWVWL